MIHYPEKAVKDAEEEPAVDKMEVDGEEVKMEAEENAEVTEKTEDAEATSKEEAKVPQAVPPTTEEEQAPSVPFLDVPAHTASTKLSIANMRFPVFVGDIKLSEFRALCHRNGLQTDFYAGDLVLNQCVVVRTGAMGQLTLEGSLSPTYYPVRALLYGKHAIL